MNDGAFGDLLRTFRTAAGLSQEALAERARLSPGAISTLERNAHRAPQQQTLEMLADALNLGAADRERLERAAAAGRRRGPASVARAPGSDRLSNLPNILTSFHGRESECADLTRLLSRRRLVTLLGSGGVGKTRLALEVSRAQFRESRFPGGVWFVDLAPLQPDLIVTAVARVLGVRERPNEALEDTLVAALADKHALLLLDNCEHVLEECARVAETLFRACAGIVMLATTREALRIDGECVYRVAPLSFEGPQGGGDAMELLLERLIDADFARFSNPSDADLADVATICRRLDGIPLALELAAARARELSLATIAAGLDERFTLLVSGSRTASPRRHTLRGMMDWSFALLVPGERRLLARLGLFAGSFSAEGAVAIAAEDAEVVRAGLEGLTAKSLLIAIEQPDGRLRYRLLETIRAYALERLREADEYDVLARRFADHFCALAKIADASYGRIPNADFLASVERDLDNFRTALEWTLGTQHDVALGVELAAAMGWIFRQTALFAEGVRWTERALRARETLGPLVIGRLHMALSFLHFNMGAMQLAFDAAVDATATYCAIAAPSELCWSLTQQVYCLYMLGDVERARKAAVEAVAVGRGQDDAFRLAGAYNALAITIPLEQATERLAALEEAIVHYRAAGDEGAVVPTVNLAETYYAVGNFAAALSRGRDVVALTRKNRDRSNLAAALTNVAAYALAVDDLAQAERSVREALELMRDLGKTLNAMCALQHAGTIAARRGDDAHAARLLGASNELYRQFGLEREFTERSLYETASAKLCTSLGEAAFQEHLAAGAALPLDDAISAALSCANDTAAGRLTA